MSQTEPLLIGKCVYILKTGRNLYKIGKTQDLRKRLVSYHTHLPVLFRVVRQYAASNMTELEECLHVLFQHRRLKGEWFRLSADDLTICDNLARNFALDKLPRRPKKYPELQFSDNPLLQVMEANAQYLRSYSRIVQDLKLGLSTNEIVDLYEGAVSKTTIDTVRKVMQHQTPNAELLGQWIPVVNDLAAGLTEAEILGKYPALPKATLSTIKRILRNQLY